MVKIIVDIDDRLIEHPNYPYILGNVGEEMMKGKTKGEWLGARYEILKK